MAQSQGQTLFSPSRHNNKDEPGHAFLPSELHKAPREQIFGTSGSQPQHHPPGNCRADGNASAFEEAKSKAGLEIFVLAYNPHANSGAFG